jgi:uncharacterized protein (DUF58 family)
VRLRSIAAAGVAAVALAALLHSPALVFAALCAAFLAALVVVTRRRVFAALTFERTLSRRVVSWGGEVEVTVSVTNAKLLPLLWMRIRDQWPAGLEPLGFTLRPRGRGIQVFEQTVSVRWYERLRRRYRVRCTERGLHRFGPVELVAGDPFGVAGVSDELDARAEIAVLPKVLDVPGFEAFLGRPLAEEAAARSLACDPTALRGIREYRAGDPLRAINWRATARVGTLQTNEFEPASLAAVRLLLDVGVLQNAWQGIGPESMELLCVVTASLAGAFAAQGFGVGLASNARLTGDWRTADIEPAQGTLPEILEMLARVHLFTARDFERMLAVELADERSRAECVVVTAALRETMRDWLALLRAERTTRVVYVGRPTRDEARFVDAVVPADFDWRSSDALPLLA